MGAGTACSLAWFISATVQRAFSDKMMPAPAAPPCDGKGEFSSNFAREVNLWRRGANFGATDSDSSLVLQTDPTGRHAPVLQTGIMLLFRMASGSDQLSEPDAGATIMKLLRD